jgi:hypothetical protein
VIMVWSTQWRIKRSSALSRYNPAKGRASASIRNGSRHRASAETESPGRGCGSSSRTGDSFNCLRVSFHGRAVPEPVERSAFTFTSRLPHFEQTKLSSRGM